MTSGIEPKADDTETLENGAVYCMNCDERLMGSFCYSCGQKNVGPRLNAGLLLHNLFEAITNVDSRLWRTLFDLFKNPGRVAKRYIEGARAYYINPVQFFLATFAVYIAFLAGLDWLEAESLEVISVTFENDSGNANGFDERAERIAELVGKIISEQRDLFTFITLPIFAYFLKLVFRKDQLNFAETITFVCFTFGMIQMYGFGIAIIQFLFGIPYNGSQGWVYFFVMIQSTYGFYSGGWMRSCLMGIAALLVLWIVQILVASVLAVGQIFLF